LSATQVQDDGFHEIQLNGKQLVFLFMAATVVSVVIFLCGVLVGRGVKVERAEAPAADSSSAGVLPESPPAIAPASAPAPAPAAAVAQSTAAAPPVPAEDDFTYPKVLDDKNAKETLKPPSAAVPPPAPAAAAKTQPLRQAPVAAAPKEVKAPAAAPPAATTVPAVAHADGYAIQVAALRTPGEADTIAKRLVSKGYDAYVLTPPGGTPNVYRVRVGSFKTRRDAEPVAAKLQQEEQFKPWITR